MCSYIHGPFCASECARTHTYTHSSSHCEWLVCPSSVAGAELYTIGLSAAECFVQHNTKPARMWRYRSSCPIVSEGEKTGIESAKLRM